MRGLTLVFVGSLFLLIIVPWLAPELSKLATNPDLVHRLAPPFSQVSWLGTEQHGVPIWSILVYGAHLSLGIAVTATAINLVLGVALGLLCALGPKSVDFVIFRISEILQAFPGTLLLITMAAILPPGFGSLLVALTITGWISFLRISRALTLQLKSREFIEAEHALGSGLPRIILFHLIPNLLPILVIQITFGLAATVLAESTLAFLGLGMPPGTPSWGALLAQGKDYLFEAPWIAIFPGLALALTLGFINSFGDKLRDRFDPKGAGSSRLV